jgi:hypothetical protein
MSTHLDNNIPEWKAKIFELKNYDMDLDKVYHKQFGYDEHEVGIRNRRTESHIKIFDNGNIEMFAGSDSGITISDVHDTVNMYGFGINMMSQYLNIRTNPNGLIINNHIFNPQLYMMTDDSPELLDNADLALDASVRYWVEETEDEPAHWSRRNIQIRPFKKLYGDGEFENILKELGIYR